MLHPPGPGALYPKTVEELLALEAQAEAERAQAVLELNAAKYAEGNPFFEIPEDVIETPPEWGRPDEGNPNQPRRPPEYNPPQVITTQQQAAAVWSANAECAKCFSPLSTVICMHVRHAYVISLPPLLDFSKAAAAQLHLHPACIGNEAASVHVSLMEAFYPPGL